MGGEVSSAKKSIRSRELDRRKKRRELLRLSAGRGATKRSQLCGNLKKTIKKGRIMRKGRRQKEAGLRIDNEVGPERSQKKDL